MKWDFVEVFFQFFFSWTFRISQQFSVSSSSSLKAPPSPPPSVLQELQDRLLLWLDWHEEADFAEVLDSKKLWLAAGGIVRLFSWCLAVKAAQWLIQKNNSNDPLQTD